MTPTEAAACYRAVESRDRRFDGVFYTGVRTTGIYCRPSCPARTPHLRNVSFHPTAAAAQAAGFRACKRCVPDATPGSPDWDVRADTAGRAMRLIADGVVERDGVPGLARLLGYSERHLTRLLTEELGAGPLALARARRAQHARTLIESTTWPLSDVAFASGFKSVRQFNDTVREVYGASPTQLRRSPRRGRARTDGTTQVDVRLPVRTPFDAAALLGFLSAHAVQGVESATAGCYTRSLRLPHGPGVVTIDLSGVDDRSGIHLVPCSVEVSDLRDLVSATERCRRLLDADCDPVAVDADLAAGRVLAPLVARHPGLRVPGHVDGDELPLRTLLGQQVSVSAGNKLAGRLGELAGEELPGALRRPGVERLFPEAADVARCVVEDLPMPRARAVALVSLARALATGEVRLDRGVPRELTRQHLLAVRGVGPWTAGYVVMRALGDPDVFLPSDAAARRVLRSLGEPDPAAVSERWRPWRSYALIHLWTRAREDD